MKTTLVDQKHIHQAFFNYLERIQEEKISPSLVKPSVVMAFWQKYPTAIEAGWVKFNTHLYGVFFKDRLWYKFARFTAESEWIDSRIFAVSLILKPEMEEAVNKLFKKGVKVLSLETILSPEKEAYYELLVKQGEDVLHVSLDSSMNTKAKQLVNGVKVNQKKNDDDDSDEEEPTNEDDDFVDSEELELEYDDSEDLDN